MAIGAPKHIFEGGQHFVLCPDGQRHRWGSIDLLRSNWLSPPPPQPQRSLLERCKEQQDLLIQNTSLFLTLQFLWQRVFTTSPLTFDLYTKFLDEARTRALQQPKSSLAQELKKVFLEHVQKDTQAVVNRLYLKPQSSHWGMLKTWVKIARLKISRWLFGWRAGIVYRISNKIIQPCVKTALSTHLKMWDSYQEKVKGNHYALLKNELIHNLDRSLTILNGSYTAITHKGVPTGTIQEMVAQGLHSKDANLGVSSEELYGLFAKTVIISTLGQLKGTFAFWALGWCHPEAIVDSLVQTAAGSVQDEQGYSHAIKSFLLDQLTQLEDLLDHPLPPDDHTPISEERERKLSIIIHQLLELLYKSECPTVDRLKRLIRDGAESTRRRQLEVYGLALLMNTIVGVVSDLIETNVNEDRIEQLTFQALKSGNDAFLPVAIEKSEYKRTEEQLNSTVKRVLNKIIDTGIDRSFCNTESLWGPYSLPNPLAIGKKIGLSAVHLGASYMPFVRGVATERVLGLIRMITERNTYLCVTHHMALIPHVKAMNPGSRPFPLA